MSLKKRKKKVIKSKKISPKISYNTKKTKKYRPKTARICLKKTKKIRSKFNLKKLGKIKDFTNGDFFLTQQLIKKSSSRSSINFKKDLEIKNISKPSYSPIDFSIFINNKRGRKLNKKFNLKIKKMKKKYSYTSRYLNENIDKNK